jgi:hypothetical protein
MAGHVQAECDATETTTMATKPENAPLPPDEENPKGDDAARCRVYRKQIDDLLREIKLAARASKWPPTLFEIRRHLRATFEMGGVS